MTIHEHELIASRRGSAGYDRSTELDLIYSVTGTANFTEALTHILSVTSATLVDPVNGLVMVRDQVFWDPMGQRPDGTRVFEVRVQYVDPTRQDDQRQLDTGEYRISFDTTGGQARFLTSLETVATYVPAGGDASKFNFRQAINVSGGEVQGVDVTVPIMKFTVHYRQPKAIITDAYAATLEQLTGTTNIATFKGRAAGEVLFLGASGQQGTASDPQIDYHFLRGHNLSGLTIGDITNIAKKAHDVLWCVYADAPNDTWIAKNALAAKVERVYEPADFTAIGI